jgi:hypothetical protein
MKHVRTPLHKWDYWEQWGWSWEIKVATWGSELYQAISMIVPQVATFSEGPIIFTKQSDIPRVLHHTP